MPVKIWDRDDHGVLTSSIKTSRSSLVGGEDHRDQAEALDVEIDQMIDRALQLSTRFLENDNKNQQFIKRWAIGRAIAESHILQSPHMDSEDLLHLWVAVARKCRLGVRSSGKLEERWRSLIPDREMEPKRIGRDIFAVSLWLQMQDLENALASFGGNLTNAREIRNRESLRSTKLRNALGRWRLNQHPDHHAGLVETRRFVTIGKALRARWPSKGPGSAERPEHLTDQDLGHEIQRVLAPIVDELLVRI